ncbi:histone acetyltransferase [Coemansia pectinata]|uniref:histone acetyltransferase n=1 Tax=Coemansia pectinata TaxID=1052879 RepID=A0A9W8LDV0_9FUNG|nr:histone acetyltransferase [Coemansia pectinata]
MSTYGEKYESRLNATRDTNPRQGSESNGVLAINRKRVHSDDGDDGEIKDDFDDYEKEDEDAATDTAAAVAANGEEKTAMVEEQQGLIRFEVVYNDSEDESMRRLTELKNIFQKQLPKMPKEYIARLVYDRNHSSLAIVKSNGHVVGGITFRLFEQRQFAEIVFCAVSSSEQVKGFTKDITLDKRLWMGYIKDYEGGTLMQCSMVEKVEYLKVKEILNRQREASIHVAVLEKIRAKTRSQIVYPGLNNFKQNPGLTGIDPFSIPGISESGWTPEMDEISRSLARSKLNTWQINVVSEMLVHHSAWPFQKPVDPQEVPDYYVVVKEPMDLMTLESNVDENKYPTLEAFVEDTRKIFLNCKNYNGEGTRYWRCATSLEKFFDDKVREWKARSAN